jgi:hypothetical protein
MIVREIAGRTWYVEVREYPSGLMAKRAWERAERKLKRGPGEDGIGVTRLAPNPAGGIPTGLSGPAVAIVSLDEPIMLRAQRLLKDGTEFEPSGALADALIARRARIVLARAGRGEGRVSIRRPEDRGAEFNLLGETFEPKPGQG